MKKKIMALLILFMMTLFLVSCDADEPEVTTDEQAETTEEAAEGTPMANPDSLINVDQLTELMEQDNVVVVDMSERANNVIPGAIWIDRSSLYHEVDGGNMTIQSAEVVAEILGEHGISNDTTVITYCEDGNLWAARFLWVLRSYGHEDVRLLNGGTDAWIASGGSTGRAEDPGPAVTYEPNMDNFDDKRADLDVIIYATDNPEFALLDLRTQDEWDGGRIPGAMQFTYPDDILNADGTFKTVEEYEAMFANVPEDARIIVYCLGGVRSSSLYYIFTDFLGWPQTVQNYDGSWWNYEASGEPIETY